MKAAASVVIMLALAAGVVFSLDSKTTSEKPENPDMKFNQLTPEEAHVILNQGTERPFTGKYLKNHETGIYTCKQCNQPLFKSDSKFDSGTGWPSFDDAIEGAIREVPDGNRTEIECARCGGHIGHVFRGENFTEKCTRHCANSLSLDFVPKEHLEHAVFAGGCFWGVEYYFQKVPGVLSTTVGYIGGHVESPTYRQVCGKTTGHAEAVDVLFDSSKVSYESLAKLFFEIHDPTQVDRQGPDIGDQYRSAVFYTTDEQRKTAEKLIALLKDKGLDVATEVVKAGEFWPAEDYHQEYYAKNGKKPYCHIRTERF